MDQREISPNNDPAKKVEVNSGGPVGGEPAACPFCGGVEVELFSMFGSQLLTAEFYCRNCRTVFESVKR